MAKKTRPATLAVQLQAVRGELADAEAECAKLTGELADQKAATEAVRKTWRDNVDRLTAERDSQLKRANALELQSLTHYDDLDKARMKTFAAAIIGAIGWICFLLAKFF